MSGHSKWAKIKHKKAGTDAKRGATFTKIIKEITTAAREGGGNAETNVRLRAAIQRAKYLNMPSNNVENAIKKGTGELPGVTYESAVFEGYGPGGTALLIETLTDNKNRTVSELRMVLNKKNGSMAGAGSTAWLFTKKGFIVISKNKAKEDELMEIVLEAGADDFTVEEDTYEITTDPAKFEEVKAALEKKKITPDTAEMTMIPSSTVKVVGNDAAQVLALMEALEEHEDVQAVHANFDIPDDEIKEAAE